MDSSAGKVVGLVVALGLAFGTRYCNKWMLSSDVRKAMYERYSELGNAADVKAAVDRHHGAFFDECYKMGWKRTKSQFDADRYADLMDRKVQDELGDKAQIAAAEARAAQAASRAANRATEAPTIATATPVPRHRMEITSASLRAPREGEVMTPSDKRAFVLEAMVEDEAGDVGEDAPPSYQLALMCQGKVERAGGKPASVRAMGTGKALVVVHVLAPTTSQGCQAILSLSDRAGNSGTHSAELPAW